MEWSILILYGLLISVSVLCGLMYLLFADNNNNILYSSLREIKAVVRSDNEEHISIILNHEPHTHTHS